MTLQLKRITTHTKPADRTPKWYVIDAGGERLGRLASRVAALLQGKHKADYSRHQLSGDFVIVVNASRVGLSGNKRTQKVYYRHTGYIGHLRSRTLNEMLDKFPERVIEQAVKGMLPRNRLGRQMLRRLKVYNTLTHPHEAQVNAGLGKAKQAPAAPAVVHASAEVESAVAAEAQAEAEAVEAAEAPNDAEVAEAQVEETEAAEATPEATEEAEDEGDTSR
jgi:large subunit ribosomal protein L13